MRNENPAIDGGLDRDILKAQKLPVIRAYAEHYNISKNLNKNQMISRIFAIDPASQYIPLLPHHELKHIDGKISVVHKAPVLTSPIPTAGPSTTNAPPPRVTRGSTAGRRSSTRQAAKNLARALLSPVKSVVDSHFASRSKRNHLRAPPITEVPEDLPIPGASAAENPENSFPIERFPSPPGDIYTPSPHHGSPASSTDDSPDQSEGPPPLPRLELVFPPRGRLIDDGEGVQRFEPPGVHWLQEMLVDIEKGRRDLLADFEEAQREVREASDDVCRAKWLLDCEVGTMQTLIHWFKGLIGEEMMARLVQEAQRTAESGSDDDDEENGDVDENSDDEYDSSASSSSGHGNGDEQRESSLNPLETGVQYPPLSHLDPSHTGPDPSDSVGTVPSAKQKGKRSREQHDDQNDPSATGDSRSASSFSSKRRRIKAAVHADIVIPIASVPFLATPSRKHTRDDESEDEKEVENSVRLSQSSGGSNGNRKKMKLDTAESKNLSSYASLTHELDHNGFPIPKGTIKIVWNPPYTGDSDTESEGPARTWSQYEVNDEADEEDGDYVLPDNHEESEDEFAQDGVEDEVPAVHIYMGDGDWLVPRTSLHYWFDEEGRGRWTSNTFASTTRPLMLPPPLPSATTASGPSDAATSAFPLALVPSLDKPSSPSPSKALIVVPRAPQKEVDSIWTMPHPNPVGGVRRGRPLARDKERIRIHPDGRFEGYKFDETPEYKARLEHEKQIIQEWMNYVPQPGGVVNGEWVWGEEAAAKAEAEAEARAMQEGWYR